MNTVSGHLFTVFCFFLFVYTYREKIYINKPLQHKHETENNVGELMCPPLIGVLCLTIMTQYLRCSLHFTRHQQAVVELTNDFSAQKWCNISEKRKTYFQATAV